jgi:hypothetical protein
MTAIGDRLLEALRRRDYAKAEELAAQLEPPAATPVGERMRRILEEPPDEDAAPAAQDEGRHPAAE